MIGRKSQRMDASEPAGYVAAKPGGRSMGTFSAVVLVKNHRRHIRPCLETLRWCAEVVLVNDGSTDGTLERPLYSRTCASCTDR